MIRRGTTELRLLIAIIVVCICLVGLLVGLGAHGLLGSESGSTTGLKSEVTKTQPISTTITFSVVASGY